VPESCSSSASASTVLVGGSASFSVASIPNNLAYYWTGTNNGVAIPPMPGIGPTNQTETYTFNTVQTYYRKAFVKFPGGDRACSGDFTFTVEKDDGSSSPTPTSSTPPPGGGTLTMTPGTGSAPLMGVDVKYSFGAQAYIREINKVTFDCNNDGIVEREVVVGSQDSEAIVTDLCNYFSQGNYIARAKAYKSDGTPAYCGGLGQEPTLCDNTASVTVGPPVPPSVNLTIDASFIADSDIVDFPNDHTITIRPGATAPGAGQLGLRWTSISANSCTPSASSANPAWTGSRSTPGSQASLGNILSNATFSLTCSGPVGSATDTVSVIIAGTSGQLRGMICKDDNGNGVCDTAAFNGGSEVYIRDSSGPAQGTGNCTRPSYTQDVSISYTGPQPDSTRPNQCGGVNQTDGTGGNPMFATMLTGGVYSVTLNVPNGWQNIGANPKSISIPTDGSAAYVNFFMRPTPTTGGLTGKVLNESISPVSYIRDPSGPPQGIAPCIGKSNTLDKVVISYSGYSPAGLPSGTAKLDQCGAGGAGEPVFLIPNLLVGIYTVSVVPPSGWKPTSCSNSNANCKPSGTGQVTVPPDGIGIAVFAIKSTGQLRGKVENKNEGKFIRHSSIANCSGGTSTVNPSGVSVSYTNNATSVTATAELVKCGNAPTFDPIFSVPDLPAGTYTVKVNYPSGWTPTSCSDTANPNCDADGTSTVTVPPDGIGIAVFAIKSTGQLRGKVWDSLDSKFIRDSSVPNCSGGVASIPVDGVTIEYSGPVNGTAKLIQCGATANKDPIFMVPDLPVGSYTVKVIYPTSWKLGTCPAGINCQAVDSQVVTVPADGSGIAIFAIEPYTLSVSLSANPTTGSVPFNTSLTATVSGTALGTINYSFWWNCLYTGTSFATAREQCGDPDGTSGNSNGNKFDGIVTNPKTSIPHVYTNIDSFTAKVIVEKGSAPPAEDRTVIITTNAPPTVSNVLITQPNYCASGPTATINWTYADSDGDLQAFYQAQIDDNAAFNSPEMDSGRKSSGGTAYSSGPGILQFNKTYQARVKVWDSQGKESAWANSAAWSTPKHAYPQVDFTWSPTSPAVKQSVRFTDGTTFYDGGGRKLRDWAFGDGVSSSTDSTTVSHAYLKVGNYTVNLIATDSDGFTCAYSPAPGQALIIKQAIPVWKEVPPKP
ncbi:MAG: hypothetical protein G01um101444_165, partial [Parcubacteria group bacterium Gr01-1014_44]